MDVSPLRHDDETVMALVEEGLEVDWLSIGVSPCDPPEPPVELSFDEDCTDPHVLIFETSILIAPLFLLPDG